jgi:hypothetical protein
MKVSIYALGWVQAKILNHVIGHLKSI